MHVYGQISGTLSSIGTLSGTLSSGATLSGVLTIPSSVGAEPYQGEYVITPTESEQTIPILGMMATDDITVNPIPSNYGLITYNGSTIMVS